MSEPTKVIHYINQFFGGIGGEDKAEHPVELRRGPVGPGLALEKAARGAVTVTHTIICGDGYFVNHEDVVLKRVVEMAREATADALIAGPAFNSGRYGLACGAVCARVQADVGLAAVTAMHRENPGVDLYRRQVLIVPAGLSPVNMGPSLEAMARLARKLVDRQPIGTPEREGYITRQIRIPERVGESAAERAIRLVTARVNSRPFQSEYVLEAFEPIQPPAAIPPDDLPRSLLALVSECGVVPNGNPDRLESWKAKRWFMYPLPTDSGLPLGAYRSVHAGYNTQFVDADPNRVLPVDALRALEREGVFGSLLNHYLITTGQIGEIAEMKRIGREMAGELKKRKVRGVVLTST
jgi:betaine reductase